MFPILLKIVVILMALNGVAYLALGIVIVIGPYPFFPLMVGIWFICWSVFVFFYVAVIDFYRKSMFQQLMNRGLVIAAYPPAVMMPGIPVLHTAIPGGMYPPVMTVHGGQPGLGITTQLQPGTYAQPGAYAQPVTYALPRVYVNSAFYSDGGTYVHPQLGAYPPPGAYPVPGNTTQPGIHTRNGPASPYNDQPPPYAQNRGSSVH